VTRLLLALALAGAMLGAPSIARAHDAYDDSESNPLRLAAYAIYPAGWAIEWAFVRPIHFLVSNPTLEPIFGHTAHESSFSSNYPPYDPDQP
jgi:hypothetical protein